MSDKRITAGCLVDWRQEAYLQGNIYLSSLQRQYGYGPFYVKKLDQSAPDQVVVASISTKAGIAEVDTLFLRFVESQESPAYFLDPAEIATD